MKNDCTIVILSFNVKDITDKCIQYAKVSADFSQKKLNNQVKIVVVDNGSTDGTVEMVRKKYNDITFMALLKNTGVAYGYNIGMKQAKTPYMLLINSDTFLHESTIFDSLVYMNNHKNCDVLTGKITGLNEPFNGVGGYLPTPAKTINWLLGFENIPFFKHFMKRIYRYGQDHLNKIYFSKDRQLEWVPTCFFFIKKAVFEQTHGHDEKMFLYMEDLEWCKRIHDQGMNIFYTPSIQATHLGGESTSKKTDISYLFLLQRNVDGIRYYHNKHHAKTVWLVDLFLKFGLGVRGLYYTLSKDKTKAYAYKNIVFN